MILEKTFRVIKTRKVDEETEIQALDRTQAVLLLQLFGKIKNIPSICVSSVQIHFSNDDLPK